MTTLARQMLFPAGKSHATTLVDPVAFTLALVGAPLIAGIIGAPLLLIPSFAVLFGGPLYLLFGTPLLWMAIRRGMTKSAAFSGLATKTMLTLLIPITLLVVVTADSLPKLSEALWLLSFYGAISVAMAALWGQLFGVLYTKLRSKTFPA